MTSGGGGNLAAILQNENHFQKYQVIKVISNRDCAALKIADSYSINSEIIEASESNSYFRAIPDSTDLIVLAGFMPIIPKDVCVLYKGKIINTHPSLLPKYGGKGMYGVHIHEAVLEAKESVTGCTIHVVTEEIDQGPIIEQAFLTIPPDIDAWTLGSLVFELEKNLLPKVILQMAQQSSFFT